MSIVAPLPPTKDYTPLSTSMVHLATALAVLALAPASTAGSWVYGVDYTLNDDVQVPLGRHYRGQGNAGIMTTDKLWPEGKVNYAIRESSLGLRSYDPRVKRAVAHIEDRTCVRFTKYEDEGDCPSPCMIFVDDILGCSSMVGKWWTGRHRITISDGCEWGSVVHEILHGMGMTHEQNRNDRDEYVQIRWEWLDEGRENLQFQKRGKDGRDIGPYSYDSIMHYSKWAFGSSYKKEETMIAPEEIGQRDGMSAGDVLAIQFMYQNCQAAPAAPDCVASKATDVVHTVLQDATFGVEFNGQFLKSSMTVTYEGTDAPAGLLTFSEPAGARVGDAGKTVVRFSPTSKEALQTYTLSATFTGPTGASATCRVAVRVSEHRLTPAPPTPAPPTPVPPTPLPPVPESCEDLVVGGNEWHMGGYRTKYSCTWLAASPVERCHKNGGETWRDSTTGLMGREACCICGGGTTGPAARPSSPAPTPTPTTVSTPRPTSTPRPPTPTPAPTELCTDKPVPSGPWHMRSNPDNDCTYVATRGRPDTYCAYYSKAFWAHSGTGMLATEACCACGGGVRGATPEPTFAPTPTTSVPTTPTPPTPTPTRAATPAPPTPLPPTAIPPGPSPAPATPVPTTAPATPLPPTAPPPSPVPLPATAVPTSPTGAPAAGGACRDARLPSKAAWYLLRWPQYDCAFIEEDAAERCEYYGTPFWGNEVTGANAKEACCVCGGGQGGPGVAPTAAPTAGPTPAPPTTTPLPTKEPTPAPTTAAPPTPGPTGGSCADRRLPSGGVWHMRSMTTYGCAFMARGPSRCAYYSGAHWRNSEDQSTANEACCVCGGGMRS